MTATLSGSHFFLQKAFSFFGLLIFNILNYGG